MRIGVDIGGSKIEVAALDQDGSIRQRRRSATPAGDYGALIDVVKALVESIEGELGDAVYTGNMAPCPFE